MGPEILESNSFFPMDSSPSEDLSVWMVPFRRDDVADTIVETVRHYTDSGFHPVRPGEVYADGRYKIIRKLGYGSYSTVWLTEEIA